ncbi:hypothetical protein PG995_002911 [Apiospora arundinis]
MEDLGLFDSSLVVYSTFTEGLNISRIPGSCSPTLPSIILLGRQCRCDQGVRTMPDIEKSPKKFSSWDALDRHVEKLQDKYKKFSGNERPDEVSKQIAQGSKGLEGGQKK